MHFSHLEVWLFKNTTNVVSEQLVLKIDIAFQFHIVSVLIHRF